MIGLQDVTTSSVLRNLSLRILEGEHIVICGPSGAGKTTLLRVIAGLEPLTSGTLIIDNQVCTEGADIIVPPHRRQIGMVFQDLGLWPHLSVSGNIALAAPSLMRRKDRRQRVDEVLKDCSLAGFGNRRINSLSGGELSRAALARALISRPRILLLDEPFSGLDVILKEELTSVVCRLTKEEPVTVVSVIHDAKDAFALHPDRVVCMIGGDIADDLTSVEIEGERQRSVFLQKWCSTRQRVIA